MALGRVLRGVASSAIDVSDGLLADLGHIARASGLGAEIDASKVPASQALGSVVADPVARQQMQLAGGDDYELCFAAPPSQSSRIEAIGRELDLLLTPIGRMQDGRGVDVINAPDPSWRIQRVGFDHFAERIG